jgi:hypothetical protein
MSIERDLVSVCARNDAVRSSVASGFILAQPINSVEVAKLAFCNWLCYNYEVLNCYILPPKTFISKLRSAILI